ncbi:MAG TPA: serine hydrolase domain-containing protein [Candidatus Acidoferrales bacterium]|jgi:CubicO group peptidase (beta-lactamase class C family)|nr:serine hydrolase domain-containing protein [Candidatus Acidoferrales bacterium]
MIRQAFICQAFRAWALLLTLAVLVRAQGDAAAKITQVNRIVESAFKATGCPGLSVAVSARNRIIYSKAMGFSDIEQNVPLRTDSAHRLASLSKPVTGTIVMDLVQSGRLQLDTPVKTYLADLPTAYDRVTVRHLLSHQAGVRGYRDTEEVFSSVHYATSRDALRAFVNDPLLFEPGTNTEYSTFGFTMAGAVAEGATRETFQDLSKDFFRRYGITGFDLDDPRAIVAKRVRGYLVDTHGKIANTRAYDASNKYPGGGFTASAEDYLRFAIAVGSGHVLKPETLRQIWTPQQTSDGTNSPFGLGWGISQLEGRRMVGFNGLQPSATASTHYFPQEGVGIVLLCNAEVTDAEDDRDLSKLMADLQKELLSEPR